MAIRRWERNSAASLNCRMAKKSPTCWSNEPLVFDCVIVAETWGRMPPEPAGWKPALVRLRRRWVGAVEVRSHAVENRVVSNRNCVAATRGGEQWNENDQSVTNVLLGRRTP